MLPDCWCCSPSTDGEAGPALLVLLWKPWPLEVREGGLGRGDGGLAWRRGRRRTEAEQDRGRDEPGRRWNRRRLPPPISILPPCKTAGAKLRSLRID